MPDSVHLMLNALGDDPIWRHPTRSALLRVGHAVRRGLGMFALIMTLIPAIGHLARIEVLYQPIPGGAGTHPLTLLSLGALALAVLIQRPFARSGWPEKILLMIAGGVAAGGLAWIILEPSAPGAKALGANTAIGALGLASAFALRRRRPSWPAILMAGTTGMICLSAFLGYAMGLGRLHGALSPYALMIMLPLVVAAQIGQAHRPMLRALLLDDPLTRMLRFELTLAVLVPAAVAIALFRLSPGGPSSADAIYTQVMIVFCCAGVLVAGRMRDRLDRERRALARELQRASLVDPLTGLVNRRGTIMMANHVVHAARRGGVPVSIVLCDLDHFKSINDRLGHLVGDKVLQAAATLLSRRVRVSDISGRWGGEEFLFLLPNTPLESAEALAEILRNTLAEELRIMPSGEIAKGPGSRALTASFGCAALDFNRDDGFEDALETADRALYAAKRGGRNRVATSSSHDLAETA